MVRLTRTRIPGALRKRCYTGTSVSLLSCHAIFRHVFQTRMKWSTADIIDLEYFLAADREKDERELRQRDETIYVRDVKPCLDDASLGRDNKNDNRAKIRCWLEARRAAEQQSAPMPGEFYRMSFRSLFWIAAVVGCLFGGGLALSLFRWYGDRPINVTWFFAETVLVQVAILCAVLFFLV